MLNQDTRYKGSADDSRVLYLNHFKRSYHDGIKYEDEYFENVNGFQGKWQYLVS
mgnify:CR=1 FL=1